MRLKRPVRQEDGIALVAALAVMLVLGLTAFALLGYTGTNGRSASRSASQDVTFRLAEAGINEALAVLANAPTINPSLPSALPTALTPRTTDYAPSGSVTWWGSYDQAASIWTITSRGRAPNPTGGGAGDLTRTLSTKARVAAPPAQPVVSDAWDYVYTSSTGSVCDMTLSQSVNVTAPLYSAGNLCLANTATINQSGRVDVRGRLTLSSNQNRVGKATERIDSVQLGAGCEYNGGGVHDPCGGDSDNVFANTLGAAPATVVPPSIDWQTWYDNASPGPRFPCQTQGGIPPTFDTGDGLRNNSVTSVFNLTPASSYSCVTNVGEISWNASTATLRVIGTVYIDGSATFEHGSTVAYEGQGAIYLSGTVLLKTVDICAVRQGPSCDTSGWNPNEKLLTVAADGEAGQVPVGNSIWLKGAFFQGALYATRAIEFDTTAQTQGPLVASTMNLGHKVALSWAPLSTGPPGIPGNTPVYATITPFDYSG
jgi:Tfp pilus assembly protein PilX